MAWYEFEPESKYTVKPADDPAVERAGMAGMLIAAGWVGFLGSLVLALIFRSWAVALWGMLGSIAVGLIGGWLLPKPQRPSAASSSAP